MSDRITRKRILVYLYDIFKTTPSNTKSTDEIATALGILHVEAKGALIYLHQKGLIESFVDETNNWHQKINADGIDELEKLESESLNMDQSFEIEIPKDDFRGTFSVFISHKFDNENKKLALTLRELLRSNKIEGYLAESKSEYDLLIGDKIRKEIDNCEFVVGIITKQSEKSSSVNQELGYALGRGKPVIMMVEKNIPHGVLTHGRDPEEFTKENFSQHCKNVVEYIIKNNTKKRSALRKHSEEYDIVLDKFTEDGIHKVGIRNAGSKTIKSCIVFCNFIKCEWWDDHDSNSRNILSGGGGNVILPYGFTNINPIISIKSEEQMLEESYLSEIPRRPSTKWSGEDENEERVKRLSTALGRIISDLAILQSLFVIFNEYPKGIPISPEIELQLNQKNDLVESIQLIATQASSILEMDWVSQLNDLCRLSKNNPWFLSDSGLKVMQPDHCAGIIAQIGGLLNHLPNPPL